MVEFTTNGYFSSTGSSLSTPPPPSVFPFHFFKCNLESCSQREVLKFCMISGDGMGKKKKSLKATFSFYLGLYLQQSGDH